MRSIKAVLHAMKKYQVGDEVRFTAHVNITTATKALSS